VDTYIVLVRHDKNAEKVLNSAPRGGRAGLNGVR